MSTVSSLSSVEKAAAIIVTLGSENASKVFKHLKEEEIEKITLEISRMQKLTSDEVDEIMNDFYGLCVTQKVITEGGMDYAKDVLEKAFGQQMANSYMERLSNSLKTKAFDFIRKVDYKNIISLIQNEHPQTMAVILSYARADQASAIISEMSSEKQIEIIERIANLDKVSPDILSIVEEILKKRFSYTISVNIEDSELGGLNYIADIMNNVDRKTEKQILDELYKKSPELTDEIRKLMFVFEDIIHLDDTSVQRFLRDVDNKDLCVALKAANEEVRQLIFNNMSSRVREQVEQDIQYLKNVRMSDVEEAQQRIVAIIRGLEEAGELIISKGGKDEILV